MNKLKAFLIKYRIHKLIEPLTGFLENLIYMSKLSKWISNVPLIYFNDNLVFDFDYTKRYSLYQYIIIREKLERINYIEFGVSEGHSFKWWVEHNIHEDSVFIGFDTFTGLPEDWNKTYKKGSMLAEIPKINDGRCFFEIGLFQDTLPEYLNRFDSDNRNIIHMDADIYSATLYALTSIARILKSGDIIIFDEFNVPKHEFKAFTEFVESYYIKYEVIGAVNNYHQIAIKII